MLVEFLGAPGAGKSTLVRPVEEALRSRGLSPQVEDGKTRVVKMIELARFVAAYPRYTSRSITGIVATRQRTLDDLRWVTTTWFKRSARMHALRQQSGMYLVEVGILQAMWSIGLRAGNDRWIDLVATLGETLPVAHVVVQIDAQSATIARRLAGRSSSHSRLEQNDIDRARSLIGQIAVAIGQASIDVELVRIDNDQDDLKATAAKVATTIERSWRRSG